MWSCGSPFNVCDSTNCVAFREADTAGNYIFEWDVRSHCCLYEIGRAINDVTINGIFGAGGDTLFDMYSLAVCMWCLAIPLAAAGTYYFHWPVVVVYACTCIDEVGKLPWVLHHFRKYKWVKDLTR